MTIVALPISVFDLLSLDPFLTARFAFIGMPFAFTLQGPVFEVHAPIMDVHPGTIIHGPEDAHR